MIKDIELRKNNYIYFNPNGQPFIKRVKELREFDLVCCGEDQPGQRLALYYTGGDVEPIALTVEWMARLGFEWNATDERYYIQIGNTLYLEFDTDFDCFITPESWGGSCPWSAIKHVHQLQNLYFALTGNELEIKF